MRSVYKTTIHPFCKWLNSASNRMLGKKFKFSGPVRVDRTAGFKISTHNFGHKNHRSSNRDLHSVVHKNKAHCKINQLFELIEMIHEKMFSALVAKDHHEIKSIKSLVSKGQSLKCGDQSQKHSLHRNRQGWRTKFHRHMKASFFPLSACNATFLISAMRKEKKSPT